MIKVRNNITVYVGMSGGVDSSVTAGLLVESGYRVVGVFMKNWSKDLPGSPCTWKEDFQDAKRVAVSLGIEFKMYDFESEYRQKVVDYMLDEYKAGRTPNPDIMCNQEVKFKLFLDAAINDGADMIATGHYARVSNSNTTTNKSESSMLLTAKNTEKDQTYFLYRVSEQALRKTLFPIGDFKTKAEVREIAKKMKLPTADKKDSQGICFVGQVGIKDFIEHELGPQKLGEVIDVNGKPIGSHQGAIFYTIGQRHGLNIGGGLPYYVIGKNMKLNQVFVTTDIQDSNLWSKEIRITQAHWINKPPETNKIYSVRTRYRAPLINGIFDGQNVLLQDEAKAVTPGQSVVLYDGEIVLGGGVVY